MIVSPPEAPTFPKMAVDQVEVIVQYLNLLVNFLGLLQVVTPDELDTQLANYPTIAAMNTAIANALIPYSTTTQMNTAITNAINAALVNYSTTAQMNAAIDNAHFTNPVFDPGDLVH